MMDQSALPPTYDELVERYGLDILKTPGDLVIKDGNIAQAKSGDLMLNDPVYSAMFRLVQSWRFTAPALQNLFDLLYATKRRRRELERELNQTMGRGSFQQNHQTLSLYHELNDQIGASELASNAYAGSVVIVLSGLLRAFKDDMDATRVDWEKTAPLVGGCSIGSILVASANNFRHIDEWVKRRRPTSKQLVSIRVLAAVFRVTIATDGIGHPFGRDISSEILDLLSAGSFDNLSTNLFAFANNMANRLR